MRTSLTRLIYLTLLLTLPLPKAVWGQDAPTGKLDESLQRAVDAGCPGPQAVIIRTKPGYRQGLRESLKAHGDAVVGEFASIDAVAATVHCGDLATLASFTSTESISFNGPVGAHHGVAEGEEQDAEDHGEAAAKLVQKFLLTIGVKRERKVHPSTAFLGTTTNGVVTTSLRETLRITDEDPDGSVGVAVIDSGIEPGRDFDGRITHFYDFTTGGVQATAPSDAFGHGTHVAGLIGSEFVGVAPKVRLVGVRVLDGNGQGLTSDVIRAIEFAVANRDALNIQVLNLALGHPIFEPAATDPLVQAVESAVRTGLVVVVSAGNFGINPKTGQPGYAGIASPANAPSAMTVGATRTFDTVTRLDDRVAPSSSRGPSWYDGFAKPDVVAPGDDLLSVAAVGSKLRQVQEARGNTGQYMRLSGTSMAAGVTSGVVALMIQANHGLTPNALKAVLEYSAILVHDDSGLAYDALTQGAGQINGAGALTLARAIDPTVPVGQKWLTTGVTPSTRIGGDPYAWSQAMVWGNHIARGSGVIDENRPAWALNIVWGDFFDDNIVWGNSLDNIVWGNSFDLGDNIVWGNNIVWADSLDDNIVWGNNIVWADSFDDNIVWGNNVVWGDSLIGMSDGDNIVWGNTIADDNIVWGNLDADNIVWGNLFEDNIVWGNDLDNIVWGNVEYGSVMSVGGGRVGGRATAARAHRTAKGGL